MKILIPYYGDENLETAIYHVGGIEKFIKSIKDVFGDSVILYRMDKNIKGENHYNNLLVFIDQHKPDLLVNNYTKYFFTKNFNIPVLHIIHTQIGGLEAHSFARLVTIDNNMLFVSPSQYEGWKALFGRTLNPGIKTYTPSFIFPDYPRIIMENKHNIEYDLITIGRCSKETKDPFLCHRIGQKYGLRSLVITTTPTKHLINDGAAQKKNLEYYNINCNWSGDQHTIWDLPHSDIFEYLKKSRVYVSTWAHETFGISALEAASVGLPSLLYKKNDHASLNIYKDIPNSVRVFQLKSFQHDYEMLLKNSDDTEIISNTIMRTFNKESFKFILNENFHKVMNNKQKTLMDIL